MIKKLKLKRDAEYELEMNHLKTTDFGGFRSFCLWIYFSRWCKLLLFVVIISHVAQIATGMYYAHSGVHEYDDTLANLTIFFIVFNILETIVKVSDISPNTAATNNNNYKDKRNLETFSFTLALTLALR